MRSLLAAFFVLSISVSAGAAEKTKYAGADHSMNIRTSALGLLVGIVNAQMDFKLSDEWTLGPAFASYSLTSLDISYTGTEIAARANWYFTDGVFNDGWYLGPQIGFGSAKVTKGSLSASLTGSAVGALVGYHWFWESFNMNLGGGFSASSAPTKVTLKNESGSVSEEVSASRGGTSFVLEWTLGWAF